MRMTAAEMELKYRLMTAKHRIEEINLKLSNKNAILIVSKGLDEALVKLTWALSDIENEVGI